MTFPRTLEQLHLWASQSSADSTVALVVGAIWHTLETRAMTVADAERALNALADLRDSLEGEMPEVCEAASKLVGGPL
jgi:hypothetical protein